MKSFSVICALAFVSHCFLACDDSVSSAKEESCSSAMLSSSSSRQLTELERATANFDAVEDGVIRFAEGNSTKGYVYDNGSWRYATASESAVGLGCVESTDRKYLFVKDVDYVCFWQEEIGWKKVSVFEIPKENFFNEEIEYGSVKDERDGHVYKTIDIDGMTWMAENLVYVPAAAECKDSLSVGCSYWWDDAVGITKGDTISNFYQGVCMGGWHIPDTTEWGVVLGSHRTIDLYSRVGWQTGENTTGFSIVPSMNSYYLDYRKEGYYAPFVTINSNLDVAYKEYDSIFVTQYFVQFQNDMFIINRVRREWSGSTYAAAASVRCVKDSE